MNMHTLCSLAMSVWLTFSAWTALCQVEALCWPAYHIVWPLFFVAATVTAGRLIWRQLTREAWQPA